MKFIYVNGIGINLAHVISFTHNQLDGTVAIITPVARLDIPFPHGSSFIRQFEEFNGPGPAVPVIQS